MANVFFIVAKELLICNTLDVMHCEKNLCESVLKTIFGVKDIMAICEDLKKCGIRPHLWLQVNGVRFIKPTASYVLSNEEKKWLCEYYFKLENSYTHCVFIEEKSSKRWKYWGNEVT
jgi:hypothetical protein